MKRIGGSLFHIPSHGSRKKENKLFNCGASLNYDAKSGIYQCLKDIRPNTRSGVSAVKEEGVASAFTGHEKLETLVHIVSNKFVTNHLDSAVKLH